MTETAPWKKSYGKLLQNVVALHSQTHSHRLIKEKFETLQDSSLEQKVIYTLEALGFSVTLEKLNKPSQLTGSELFILNGEKLFVKVDGKSTDEIYLTDTGDKLSAEELNSESEFNVTGLKITKVLEEFKSVKQRLKHLNILNSLGIGNFGLVAVATALSNILGLATSLFVMVVYDRVLPNQAQESLYALAAGVFLAILFDIGLKTIRSGFLEYAATKADNRVVEDIFEQYVESAKDNRTRSIGALSTVVRDFETYRDFIGSATILGLIDLPFVFIFIS